MVVHPSSRTEVAINKSPEVVPDGGLTGAKNTKLPADPEDCDATTGEPRATVAPTSADPLTNGAAIPADAAIDGANLDAVPETSAAVRLAVALGGGV